MNNRDLETIQVLHVDDEPDLGELVATFLEQVDERLLVETTTSATDALDRLSDVDGHFDCIVSDYDMPGMNGQELLETVRETHPELPFILFTGKGSEEIASKAISAGVTDYLRKGSGTDQYQLLANQIANAVLRSRTQDRLEQTQNQTDVLLEDSPVMITVSVDGQCRFVNQAGVELLGADCRDSIIGREYLDIVSPADDQEDESVLLPKREGSEGVENLERQLTTVDGQTKYVEVTARPIVFDGDDAVLAIVKDITERKQREKQLRQREHQYRTLAENFPQGMVFLFDEDFRYTVAKGRGLSNVGLDSYDLEGKTISEALPETLYELFEPRYRRALAGEEDVFELEYKDRIFRVHTLPVRDREGEVFAGMQIAPDITKERQETNTLRDQNDRLAEFTSVISHDLRNPLSIARGNLTLAQETGDTEALETVDTSLERMDVLIEDILSLAQNGLTIDTVEEVSLREVSEEAWKQVSSNGTEIVIEEDLRFEADSSRLRELLGNLFRNTIEHAESERTIQIGKRTDGFYIEDDGIGIPEEDRDDVFDSGHSTADDGTGFGLAIVEQIAEAHDWDIHITKSSNGGARFDITGVVYSACSSGSTSPL
ncbi:PAS domain S-box protein [Halorubrum aquaticum]|uniref:PAS domain S-box protein n=1 Tax=Halorubrum aquaticum TaxID=387340 RepID=UPI0031D35BAC